MGEVDPQLFLFVKRAILEVMPIQVFWVGIFGLVGVFLRWGAQWTLLRVWEAPVMWTTMGINALGSFLIGLVAGAALQEHALWPEAIRTGLMVGLLGGFTTFSSYSLDTLVLLQQGAWGRGVLLFVGSPLLGLAFAFVGSSLGRSLFSS